MCDVRGFWGCRLGISEHGERRIPFNVTVLGGGSMERSTSSKKELP